MDPAAQVRVTAILLWGVIASGPLLGVVSLVVGLRTGDEVTAEQRASAPPEVLAFAELVVSAHLRGADAGGAGPTVPPPLGIAVLALRQDLTAGHTVAATGASVAPVPGPRGLAAVSAVPAGPSRWGVEVLVLDREDAVETWQATVTLGSEGPLVEAAPTLVPSAGASAAPALAAGRPEPPDLRDPLAAAVEGYLRAQYLGDGDLSRYVPAAAMRAWDGPDLTAATLEGLAVQRLSPTDAAVLAEVVVLRPDGRSHRMHLPLLATHRQARWEVARILPAMPLASLAPDDDPPKEPAR